MAACATTATPLRFNERIIPSLSYLHNCCHRITENLDSSVNEKVDFFREQIRNFADDVSAQEINQRVALRCAEDQPGDAKSGGNIDNRFRGGRTDSVSE